MLDPNEAASLLQGPPEYTESERAVEEFEIDDPDYEDISGDREVTWFARMTRFGKRQIYIPVRYIIDPVAHLWHAMDRRIDMFIGRWVNPLLIRRLLVAFIAGLILFFVYYTHGDSLLRTGVLHQDHRKLGKALADAISIDKLQESAEFFGQMPHFAGSVGDRSTYSFVKDTLSSLGLISTYDPHDVFLSHGNYTVCQLKRGNEVLWESELLEGQAIKEPNPSQQQPRTSLALSLPGLAEAPLVYANYGSDDDMKAVEVRGNIALIKLGREDAGAIALRAESQGAKGLLFFSEKHPTAASWPDGPDYPPDAVQQTSLGFPGRYPGDILSPGWPSSMQITVSRDKAHIAHIPAAAISWNDAAPLLNALVGHGRRMDQLSPEWANHGAPKEVTEWWTGPQEGDNKVRLVVEPCAEDRHRITNVLAQIVGKEAGDRAVVIGTRLDSMCYGSSQLTGLTVLLEVARLFAHLRYTHNWEPLRTIIFAAWDGTSHNYAGATEWVEMRAQKFAEEGIAYIDLDMGISGPDFISQGHPSFEIEDLLKQVGLSSGKSLYDAVDREKSFQPIPGYGNHVAFDAHTGIPTIRFGFQGPVAPLDSCYDTMAWMSKFGDPDFSRHRALTELVARLTLELADAPLIPFDFSHFGSELIRYVGNLEDEAADVFGKGFIGEDRVVQALGLVKTAAHRLADNSIPYSAIRSEWEDYCELNANPSTGDVPDIPPVTRVRGIWNERAAQLNKMILDHNGIFNRNWYKHHVFGPAYDYRYSDTLGGTFPSVRDALNLHSADVFVETLRDAASHIEQAAAIFDAMI